MKFLILACLAGVALAQNSIDECHQAKQSIKSCVEQCAADAGCSQTDNSVTDGNSNSGRFGKREPPQNIKACIDACKPSGARRPKIPCFNDSFRTCKQTCKSTFQSTYGGDFKKNCKKMMCECISEKVTAGVCQGPAKDCNNIGQGKWGGGGGRGGRGGQ